MATDILVAFFMKKRVVFYIDGFNFYHGLRQAARQDATWRQFYWLDFIKFANQFISDQEELLLVKYFSATPLDDDKARRQSALFKANKQLHGDRVQFVLGKYYNKPIRCNHCKQRFEIAEEKRTDVNLSVHLVSDCALDKTDVFVLITADSDLIPPIEFIQRYAPDKRVRVYFPPKRKSYDLQSHASNKQAVYLEYNKLKFTKALLPDEMDVHGVLVRCPERWK